MKINERNEQFFKQLAKTYVDRDGTNLKENDLPAATNLSTDNLDKKVKARLNQRRIRRLSLALMPFAAALLIFVVYIAWLPQSDSLAPTAEMDMAPESAEVAADREEEDSLGVVSDAEFMDEAEVAEDDEFAGEMTESAPYAPSLFREIPEGFLIDDVINEQEQVTYYLSNATGESITIVVAFTQDELVIDDDYFYEQDIDGITAYLLALEDEYLLTFQIDNIRYILTSYHGYHDLIMLSQKIISP